MAVQYAVKLICGSQASGVLATGSYFTAINVHNPHEQPIEFRKKIALTGEESEQPGKVFGPFDAKLGPDEALEIDNGDIIRHTPEIPPDAFRKGFVVITSDLELDVVAVYTAEGLFGRVKTLHIDRVPPRRLV